MAVAAEGTFRVPPAEPDRMGGPMRASGPSHCVARLVRANASDAIALLSTASGMAVWNLGLWNTRAFDGRAARHADDGIPESIVCGESLFDGATGYCGVTVRRAEGGMATIAYRAGSEPRALGAVRIEARVTPGEALGYDVGTCMISLLAWRTGDMSDARWHRLCSTHETEIELICAHLEPD